MYAVPPHPLLPAPAWHMVAETDDGSGCTITLCGLSRSCRIGPTGLTHSCTPHLGDRELRYAASNRWTKRYLPSTRGADALGLVSAMPSGPGIIGDGEIARIGAWIGTRSVTVLLTSRRTAAAIDEQLRQSNACVLQLCAALPDGELAVLRARYPAIAFMPTIHVQQWSAVTEALHRSAVADALLLDSGNPVGPMQELGGTGRVHDWRVSRAIREAVRVPVFLAGGLRPANVAEAIEIVRPFGVDVCSGVRREGRLDRDLLLAFMAAVRAAG